MSTGYSNSHWPYGSAALTYGGERVRRRDSIVDALVDRLEDISIANGYQTDFEHVEAWKVTPWQDADLPGLTVKDLSDEPLNEVSRGTMNKILHGLLVRIELACSGSTPVATIRKMIGDVMDAIRQDETFGGLAIQTSWLGDEIAVEQEERTVTGANIALRIDYRTDKWLEG